VDQGGQKEQKPSGMTQERGGRKELHTSSSEDDVLNGEGGYEGPEENRARRSKQGNGLYYL